MQPFLRRPWYLPFRWNINDTSDELARQAFQSVMYITADGSTLASNVPSEDKTEIFQRLRGLNDSFVLREDEVSKLQQVHSY